MKKLLFILFFALSFTGFAQHQYTSYVTASGTNTYAVTVSVPTITNYSTKRIHLRFANANSGASTLNVTPVGASSLGAVAIRAWDGDSWEPLAGGEIATGQDYVVVYNGTYFELYPSISGGGGGSGEFTYSIQTISGTTHTIDAAAIGILNKWFIYTNASGCTVTVDDDVDIGRSVVGQRGPSAGTVTFVDNGTSVLISSSGDFDLEAVNRKASLTKQTSTDWDVTGELGPSGGGGTWGTITGTLSDQTDLQTALDAKQPLDADLTSIAGNTTGGFLTRTASNTYTARTITGTANEITVTNGDGVSGAPTIDIPTNPTLGGANITGVPISTGVSGIGTGVATALAINTGSAGSIVTNNLNQTKFWAGNSSNIPAQYLLGSLTPEMYGAAGDGVTDDATALNNLMTAANSAGVAVVFHAKTYIVGSTVTIPAGLTIYGSGTNSIIRTSANIPIFTITSASNIHIYNLTFDGSDTGATQRGIYANGNVGFTQLSLFNLIQGCKFTDFGADGIYCNFIIGSSTGSNHEGTFQISQCIFESIPGNGVNFDTRGEYNQVSDSKFFACGVGVRNVGGNNTISNNSITDNTTGILIGSGANDGHAVAFGNKINHNGSNVTCTSTATGYNFIGNEIIAGSVTINAATDIRFIGNDFDQAPLTSTNAVRLTYISNYFRGASTTFTIAAGNDPIFDGNIFTGTVPSIVKNTMQGGIQNTQQGPTSPSIETATWTTTASGQFANKLTGTITPRATTSDVTQAMVIDVSHTQTANTQQFWALDLQPTATISTGGFTGTYNGALRARGRTRFVDLTTSGAVTATSGITYEKSNADMIFQWSPDAILRIGNAGSPWQITSTSDGSAANNNGNGALVTTGAIGFNLGATNSGAGTNNARTLNIGGGSTTSSGSTTYSGIRLSYTINQTGTSTGDNYGIFHTPTITASLGNSYFIADNTTLRSGFGTITPTAKIHIGQAGTTAANSGPLKLTEGSNPTTPEDGLINYVNNNITFTETSTVYTLEKTLVGSGTIDFGSIAAQGELTSDITVTGAADGDKVVVGWTNSAEAAGVIYTARVSAADTVTVKASNITLVGVDPGSGTFKVSVIKD